MTEHAFTDEGTAYAERRKFISRGMSVSLIGFDSQRNVYAFDVDDVRECGGCEDSENHPHAFDCERAYSAETIVRDMDTDAVAESLRTMPTSAVGSPMHNALKARLNELTR